jgi:hypothetical protein
MKRSNLFPVLVALSMVFISCKQNEETTVIVDFEDVQLNSEGFWNGSDLSGTAVRELPAWGGTDSITNYYGSVSVKECVVKNVFTSEYDSWLGISISSVIDTVTSNYSNKYGVITGSGAFGSGKFAVVYDDNATIEFQNPTSAIKSIMLANATYSYLEMKNGGFGKKFTSEDNDWFKIIITGYKNEKEVGTVGYYPADFRTGKSFLSKEWVKVDLSSLGKVDKLVFTFDSSDKDPIFGVNTPKYICVDNIQFTKAIADK